MIENGFIKINIDGFHCYLDNISKIVDAFIKKSENNPVNFSVQNHKLIITNYTYLSNSTSISRIEVDHKGILAQYGKDSELEEQVNTFQELVPIIFSAVDFKPSTITRIGHAVHYIKERDYNVILQKMFSTSNKVLNISDVAIDIKINEELEARKIISTPVDINSGNQALMINADLFSAKPQNYKFMKKFFETSLDYFSQENKILEGIHG